ncbi:hypothetical protein XFF6991_180235 [Xanthomonas phaseoli pv. phaseoli]|uniref:Uncharacterized protein n=1 Tax=Xanthomonas campestris pv. phaseoli TaxID=317013 RepID=A0A7Z7IZA7_XANCH|nr:hypothetical protein XFF6991_180235 [Xanthomonas phaseoli pv. phaseoli]
MCAFARHRHSGEPRTHRVPEFSGDGRRPSFALAKVAATACVGPSWSCCHRRASLHHVSAAFQKLGRGWQFADPSGPLVWTWPEPTRFIRPVLILATGLVPEAARASREKYVVSH